MKNLLILISLLTLILGPRPLTGELELRAAYRFEAAGNHSGAASAYASAAARLPWIPSLWELAGRAELVNRNIDNSILFFNRAVGRGSISQRGWVDLGNAYQQRGDMPSAMNAWEQAPTLAEAYDNLAQAQQATGNFPDAIKDWQASIAKEPDNASAHYHLGLLFAATALKQAMPELMQAIQLNPNLEKSIQGLRTALNTALLSDNHPYQFLVSGQALAALGQWDLAAEAFQNALQENTGYAEAWAWLGQAKQNLDQDGSYEFTKALTLDPESAIIQGLYGIYLQHQGKLNAALVAYQNAADLEPDNPSWQMALGSAFEQTGDLIKAYSHYSHAVELAPENPSSWRALADFSVNNVVDVDVTGLPAARKLIELAPDDWQSYDLAGQAAFILDEYTSAETYLKKAIQLAPIEAAPAFHLGLVYLQTGELSYAYLYLNLAETFDPKGSYGWQAGRLLEQFFP